MEALSPRTLLLDHEKTKGKTRTTSKRGRGKLTCEYHPGKGRWKKHRPSIFLTAGISTGLFRNTQL